MVTLKKIISILLLSLIFFTQTATIVEANTAYKTFTEDGYGRYVETQTAYTVSETIVRFDDELFSQAQDMKVSRSGFIYVADTGNARVLVGTTDGRLVRVIGEDVLQKPTGLYISHDNLIYVADENKMKVLVFTESGELIKEFGRPEGILFGETANFVPQKVAVDRRDNVYIISRGNANGIIQINANTGQFLGYYAPNATAVSPLTAFRKLIFTEEQLDRMLNIVPATSTNLNIDDKGLVYNVSQGERVQAIRKLNVAGRNILDTRVADDFPVSVEVGSLENIFVGGENGFIYEYTSEGNLLFVFGGQDDGRQRVGLFRRLSALAVDSSDRLLALDSDRNQIQIFEPTEFADLVHDALYLYQNGDYEASKGPWEEVIRLNGLFDFAYQGLGEALYKEEQYDEALIAFRQAKYITGYSDAFWEVRNLWMRDNIMTLIFVIVFIITLFKVYGYIERKTNRVKAFTEKLTTTYRLKFFQDVAFIRNMIKHPLDTFYSIQYENKGSVLSASFWLAILYVMYIVDRYFTGFIFRQVRDGQYTLGLDTALFFGLFALVVGSNYLITTINDGEGKFKHVFIGFIYSFMPYFLFKPWTILISNVLTLNEQYLLSLANTLIYAWVAVLIFIMIKEINDYTIRETIKIIFVTIFMMIITLLSLFIVYILVVQMVQFIISVVNEGVYRFENR